MSVISFSVDERTKNELEQLSKEENRTKSDIFRDMYKTYTFNRTLTKIQKIGKEKFLALGIESIDDAEAFLG
ncbi:MAG TPA: ribbon-helix-helix protein, CopG family [Candidatus Dormibacteraeota bacterium]|nr:ribbon-helix-helix protein, CopG family [Candidatus Dormibacteraeota bacterium]